MCESSSLESESENIRPRPDKVFARNLQFNGGHIIFQHSGMTHTVMEKGGDKQGDSVTQNE